MADAPKPTNDCDLLPASLEAQVVLDAHVAPDEAGSYTPVRAVDADGVADHLASFPTMPIARVVNNDNASPDSTATTNSMDVGDSFRGSLDFAGDVDWIAIDLTAGESVRISLSGGVSFFGLGDPLLRLYNADGQQIMFNDDVSPFDRNSELEFNVYQSGTYYILADSYDGFQSGDYTVTVNAFTPATPTNFTPTDAIDWGSELADTTVNVFFANAGYRTEGITGESWNAYERGQFDLAFEQIEAVTNLTFNVVNRAADADLILVNDRNEIDDLGFFNPPGEFNAGTGVFGADDWDRTAGGDLEVGGTGYVTIVHELLHGLGLSHPHDDGGTSSILPGVDAAFGDLGAYDLNQGINTVMTYNNGFANGPTGTPPDPDGNWGFEAGPMAFDIAVLQSKYGANPTTNAGASTYVLPDGNGSGTYWTSIWDTSGTDMIRYGGSRDVTIDLRAATLQPGENSGGYVSAAKGIAGGFTIANGVVIENAEGGSGDDSLVGNDADNVLTGQAGDDSLDGERGDDLLEAGNGDDNVWGDGGNDTIRGGVGDDTLRGGREEDTIEGGAGEDSIVGQRNADRLTGGDDNDTVKGGGGNDTLFGSDGDDFLKGGTRRDEIEGGAGNDTLAGNSFDDLLDGGRGNDDLNGGGDNDTLIGGTGNDTMKGGAGNDVFVFDTGSDRDTITDFDSGEDMIELSAALAGGQNATQIANAATVTGAGVEIDLGGGDVILLEGLSNTNGLAGAIDIV